MMPTIPYYCKKTLVTIKTEPCRGEHKEAYATGENFRGALNSSSE